MDARGKFVPLKRVGNSDVGGTEMAGYPAERCPQLLPLVVHLSDADAGEASMERSHYTPPLARTR